MSFIRSQDQFAYLLLAIRMIVPVRSYRDCAHSFSFSSKQLHWLDRTRLTCGIGVILPAPQCQNCDVICLRRIAGETLNFIDHLPRDVAQGKSLEVAKKLFQCLFRELLV